MHSLSKCNISAAAAVVVVYVVSATDGIAFVVTVNVVWCGVVMFLSSSTSSSVLFPMLLLL